jgi:hypothetical protein
MDDEALSAAFERAVEVARDSKVSLSTEQLLRGYGYYKVATTRKRACAVTPCIHQTRPDASFAARLRWQRRMRRTCRHACPCNFKSGRNGSRMRQHGKSPLATSGERRSSTLHSPRRAIAWTLALFTVSTERHSTGRCCAQGVRRSTLAFSPSPSPTRHTRRACGCVANCPVSRRLCPVPLVSRWQSESQWYNDVYLQVRPEKPVSVD